MILNETVAAIADAIREKTGKSELIKPVDFATEIKGITAGGSGEGGGSNMRYYKYEAGTNSIAGLVLSNFVRYRFAIPIPPEVQGQLGMTEIAGVEVATSYSFVEKKKNWVNNYGATVTELAFSLDPESEIINANLGDTGIEYRKLTLRELLMSDGLDVDTFTEITKEEFYDLNA